MNSYQRNKIIQAIASGNIPLIERNQDNPDMLPLITGFQVVDGDGYIRKVVHFDPKSRATSTELLETPILSNHFKQRSNAT